MNYYKRHIGDYMKDASHLSLLEHGVYMRLLDVYYTREAGIPVDQAARLIGARSKDEKEALKIVTSEFFTIQAGFYVQARCELEISAMKQKAETNREAGKLGGRPKKTTKTVHPDNPKITQMVSEINPNETLANSHKPITNSHSATDVADSGAVHADAELTKSELWTAGKALLADQGMPKAQCGSFVGKLVKAYGDGAVIEAVRAAVVQRPADVAQYLVASCQWANGQRKPVNKQEALEKRNRALTEELIAEFNQKNGAEIEAI